MLRSFKSLPLISMTLICANTVGWGSAQHKLPALETPPTPPSIHFPMNEDQAWFVKPSYLILRPHQEGTDLGRINEIPENEPELTNDKTKNLDFDWGSGVRVGIGRYLPNHDQWDVTLFTTYVYNQTDTHFEGYAPPSSSSDIGGKLLNIGWEPILLGAATKSNAKFNLNYFTWDLAVGREYLLTDRIMLHPYVGLRTALIYQTYELKSTSSYDTSVNPVLKPNNFKAHNSTWGMGPRIGTDFAFHFGAGWSFMGNLAGSFLMSRYNIEQKVAGYYPVNQVTPTPASFELSDADTVLLTNLEAAFGLGWEKWVSNGSVRIAPSFLFEVSEWFGFNRWAATRVTSVSEEQGTSIEGTRKRNRNLGLLGFSVNLQVDF